jgi:hypothetical protein
MKLVYFWDITVRVQELAHQQDLVMAVIIVQKDRTSVLQHPISVHQDITVPLEVLYRYHVYQELIRISMDRYLLIYLSAI